MRRWGAGVVVLALLLGSAAPAWAAPTTEVIQGRILRLVSVADWDAAGSLLPGDEVRWDVAVSAEAPDPGIITIALSATGDAPLVLDVSICLREWQGSGCPGGAVAVRSGWQIPRDGGEVQLGEIADTDVAHVRLSIGLDEEEAAGSTTLRLHASGVGEDVTVGPGGGLAATGPSSLPPWALAGGAALVVVGLLLGARRRRDGAVDVARREPGGAR